MARWTRVHIAELKIKLHFIGVGVAHIIEVRLLQRNADWYWKRGYIIYGSSSDKIEKSVEMIKMYKKVQKGIKGINYKCYNFLHLELSYCPDTWGWASRSALISLALWRDLACRSRALFRARSDSWRAWKIRCCLIMRWARIRTAWRWERTWHELHELLCVPARHQAGRSMNNTAPIASQDRMNHQ